jgi:hypothetical protein
MKRIAWLAGISIFLATLASVAVAQDASLGDIARQTRKQKGQKAPTAKKYDNDNLPADDKISVVGQAPAESADASAPATSGEPTPAAESADKSGTPAAPAAGSADSTTAPKSTTAEDKKPANNEQAQKQLMFKEWQGKIHEQQNQVDMLTRDIDLANREYRLRAAAFYADAGNRLRNAVAWDKEDAQFKDQMADKQKKLDDAKKQLEDLQEQARRAGVPSSMRE